MPQKHLSLLLEEIPKLSVVAVVHIAQAIVIINAIEVGLLISEAILNMNAPRQ